MTDESFWPAQGESPNPVLAFMMNHHLYWLYILFDWKEFKKHRQYRVWHAKILQEEE